MSERIRRYTDPDLADLRAAINVLRWCVAAQGLALVIIAIVLWT